MLRRCLSVLLLFCFALPAWPGQADAPLRFGVLAFRPKAQAEQQWQPLATYLAAALERRVELKVFSYPELDAAVAGKAVDIVLTNPGHFIALKQRDHLSAPLVTLVKESGGVLTTAFGGTILVRADRRDLASLADLSGKRIAAVSLDSLGGYQMQAFELLEADVDLPSGNRLLVTGMPHDAVVTAIVEGRADAGFVRSGLLEEMASEGNPAVAQLRVLNRLPSPDFPFAVSTRLYPEWPLAVMPQIDEVSARRLAVALLSLPAESAAARASGIHGFTIPADYGGVENVLRRLRQPPFDALPQFTLADMWQRYTAFIVLLAILALLLAATGAGVVVQNRRLQRSRADSQQQSRRLAEVIWGTNIGTWEWNVQTGELSVNERWADIVGYRLEELAPVSIATWEALTHPDDRKHSDEMLQRCFGRESENYECEVRMRHRNGDWVWVLDRGRVVEWTADGQPLRMSGTHLEITARKQLQSRLQLAASVFTHAHEGIMITDAQSRIVDVNDTFCRITGYAREEVLGANPRLLKSGHQSPAFYAAMRESLLADGHWSGEVWNRRKNGELYAELLTISTVRDAGGVILNYVALFADITPIKQHQQQLEYIAHFDTLTRLPNRALLADRLQQAMVHSQRRGLSLAVVYLDLDGFKAVNDQHGHALGDQLLIALAQRMKAVLREGDTLARLGGDEFVAVLVDLEHAADCDPVLDRLLHAAAEPLLVGEVLLQVSASIGVTLYPQDGSDADGLLRHADQAMYRAKQAGRNRFELFVIGSDLAAAPPANAAG